MKREQRQKLGDPPFVDRTMEYFKRHYLEHVYTLEDDELRRRVRHGIDKARGYGLTWESSLTIFVAHMLTINPKFDEQRAIHEVLVDPAIPGDERMEALLGLVEDEDWDEAEKQCDPEEYWRTIRDGGG
jgi:hypothetical protein